MEKERVILYPGLGMGHLLPMIQVAKLFSSHNYSVTIILLDHPFPGIPSIAPSFISHITSTHPSITFHRLPKPQLPTVPNPTSLLFKIFSFANPLLLHFLTQLSLTASVRALVLDMLCTPALDVASNLNIPAYFFFASGASCLAAFLYYPALHEKMNVDFKDLGDSPVSIPGCAPIPASHLLESMQQRDSDANRYCLEVFSRLPESNGIMVNSFVELERRAVQALREGLCVPGRKMPPVYCVGPVDADESSEMEERHACLTWLDGQPEGSVVFLCFGSVGSFSDEQFKEIAIGLERSGQRFLWCVRSPKKNDIATRLLKQMDEVDLDALMPDGFVDRTKEAGLMVKSWVPQVEVLRHRAVGGFVTHCGWNSVMEAVSSGVGMVCWPLHAEQRMNKVLLVDKARLGVEMEGYDKEAGVTAEEVERKVRWLMESEDGRELKERVKGMKEGAVAAKNGGSSEMDWMEFVSALREMDYMSC